MEKVSGQQWVGFGFERLELRTWKLPSGSDFIEARYELASCAEAEVVEASVAEVTGAPRTRVAVRAMRVRMMEVVRAILEEVVGIMISSRPWDLCCLVKRRRSVQPEANNGT
jgi:hypothetical protein